MRDEAEYYLGWDQGASSDEFLLHFDPLSGSIGLLAGVRFIGVGVADFSWTDWYGVWGRLAPATSGTSALYLWGNGPMLADIRFDYFPVRDVSFNLRPYGDFSIRCFDENGETVVERSVPGTHVRGGLYVGGPVPIPAQLIVLEGRGIRKCSFRALGGSLDDFRFRIDRDELEISCVGDLGENRVTRGEVLTCTAKGSAESDSLEIETWSFSGTDSRGEPYLFPEADDSPVTDNPWRGKMAISGTVKLRASINGGEVQEVSTGITVVARSWERATVESNVQKVSYAEYPADDRPPAYPRVVHDLGRTSMEWQPLPLAENSEQISDFGPNHYLIYVTGVPAKLILKVLVHPETEIQGAFWRRQASSQPTYSQQPVCVRSQFDRYVQLILAHEGYPPNPQSHSGVFIAEFSSRAASALEDMVYLDRARNEMAEEVVRRLAPIADQALVLADVPVDDRYKIPFLCEFNFEQR